MGVGSCRRHLAPVEGITHRKRVRVINPAAGIFGSEGTHFHLCALEEELWERKEEKEKKARLMTQENPGQQDRRWHYQLVRRRGTRVRSAAAVGNPEGKRGPGRSSHRGESRRRGVQGGVGPTEATRGCPYHWEGLEESLSDDSAGQGRWRQLPALDKRRCRERAPLTSLLMGKILNGQKRT